MGKVSVRLAEALKTSTENIFFIRSDMMMFDLDFIDKCLQEVSLILGVITKNYAHTAICIVFKTAQKQ